MTLTESQPLAGNWTYSRNRSLLPPRGVLLLVVLFWLPQLVATAADWETHEGYRLRALEVGRSNAPGFVSVDPAVSGIRFTNTLSEEWLKKDSSLLSGSGVALGDIDGDGLCDIYFCSLAGRNALYHNLGNWRFEE